MTNERAIELLNRISDSQFDGIHGDERREALEMAVRALFSQQIVNDSQGLVNDCISRQAAIDLLKQMRKDGNMIPWEGKDVFARIRKLPSAQPEIIRCKDCKYREYDDDYGYMCRLDTGDPYCTGRNAEDDEWFCADAERRQDE